MRKIITLLFCLSLAAGLSACGGDGSDFEGTYEVTKHTRPDGLR